MIHDVSRIGVRLHVRMEELGAAGEDGLSDLARRVEHRIGAAFNADVNPESEDTLVRKRMRTVRMGREACDAFTLVLGCEFVEPLSKGESSSLELDLPPLDARPVSPSECAVEPEPFEAFLHPTRGWRGRLLAGTTPGMEDGMALLRIDRATLVDGTGADDDALARALTEKYGPRPVLEVVRGMQQIWTGPINVCEVASVASAPRSVQIQLQACAP